MFNSAPYKETLISGKLKKWTKDSLSTDASVQERNQKVNDL
jgi:hypothetical protein